MHSIHSQEVSITPAEQPLVTVAVVFRERYSFASRSLHSILEYRDYPFALHYFDCQSPPSVCRHLEDAQARGELRLFSARSGTPNQLRNQALETVQTKYVCFIDNDVLVTQGWIETLVSTAERTGAGIVFPLYLMGEFSEDRIHMAGGKNHFYEVDGQLEYEEQHLHANETASQIMPALREGDSDYGEFHCMLLSMTMLEKVGPLDENYLQVHEHIDIAMMARQAGYRVIFQPGSLVSYVYAAPLSPYWLCDIQPFRRRWGHEQVAHDLAYFSTKWNLKSRQNLSCFLNRQINSMEQVLSKYGKTSELAAMPIDNFAYPYVHSLPRLATQCLENGHARQEVVELKAAFEIAAELHGSSFRGSKKPFMEHLVRTASILLNHGAPFDLVKAALLHAVFMGNTSSKNHLTCTDQNRTLLRGLVGNKVEAIVHEYFLLSSIATDDKRTDLAEVDETPIVRAQAIIVKIANDIEDLLDHAALLEQKPLRSFAGTLSYMGPVAEACGYEALVAEFGERIRLAEASLQNGSGDHGAVEWMIQLFDQASPQALLFLQSQGVSSPSLATRVLHDLPRKLLPFRVKVAARKALTRCGLR